METGSESVGSITAVCGLPGAGKSTVAPMVAEATDATHLRTDAIRAELFEDPTYDRAENEATYRVLFERATAHLRRGEDVVLDATFSDRTRREALRDLARTLEADLRMAKVHTDEAVLRERIADRERRPNAAGFAVHLEKKAAFDPVAETVTVIDNSGEMARTRERIERWVEHTT